jgi:hypothetical protein
MTVPSAETHSGPQTLKILKYENGCDVDVLESTPEASYRLKEFGEIPFSVL